MTSDLPLPSNNPNVQLTTQLSVLPPMPLLPPPFALRRPALIRRGFSLVELLVVIGIMAVMAGLVVSSLFRNRDSNRLLAAEHMLADAIRQARHTARSNNAPVELRIVSIVEGGQVTGARISGVTRVAIWGETFDGKGLKLPEINIATGAFKENGVVIGRSGYGRKALKKNENNEDPDINYPIPMYDFVRGQSLVRNNRSEGFYIACQVRPPNPGSNAYLPLLIVGDDDNPYKSQCGLVLHMQHTNRLVDVTQLNRLVSNDTIPYSWCVEGWVRGSGSTTRTFVSTYTPADRPLGRNDIVPVIVPDRWVDLGLLYDGERLMLFADGQRIAVHHGVAPQNVPKTLKSAASLFIGQATIPGQLRSYNETPMDDIRLYRLGSSEVGDLPGGVVLVTPDTKLPKPDIGYRILCHSDGRVEVYRDDEPHPEGRAENDQSGYNIIKETYVDSDNITKIRNRLIRPDDATIILSQRLVPGSLQNVSIRVGLDGRVNSELVRPGNKP
jgi:prepilin-type N-terminal cleavage/methylation domain-containing protein